jgi:hypothetical protein
MRSLAPQPTKRDAFLWTDNEREVCYTQGVRKNSEPGLLTLGGRLMSGEVQKLLVHQPAGKGSSVLHVRKAL